MGLPNLTNYIQDRLNNFNYCELPCDCQADFVVLNNKQWLDGRGFKLFASSNFNPTGDPTKAFITLESPSYTNTLVYNLGSGPVTGSSYISPQIPNTLKNLNIRNDYNQSIGNGRGIAINITGDGFGLYNVTIGNPQHDFTNPSNNLTGWWYDWDICVNINPLSSITNYSAAVLTKHCDFYNYATFGFCATGNGNDLECDSLRIASDGTTINGTTQYPIRSWECYTSATLVDSDIWGWAWAGQSSASSGHFHNNRVGPNHYASILCSKTIGLYDWCEFGAYPATDIPNHPAACAILLGNNGTLPSGDYANAGFQYFRNCFVGILGDTVNNSVYPTSGDVVNGYTLPRTLIDLYAGSPIYVELISINSLCAGVSALTPLTLTKGPSPLYSFNHSISTIYSNVLSENAAYTPNNFAGNYGYEVKIYNGAIPGRYPLFYTIGGNPN